MGEADTTADLQRIRDALVEVLDPEIGISIVDMGMVRQVEEVDGGIRITLLLTSPTCPLAEMIKDQVREAAQVVTDREVEVILGEGRWDPSMMAPPKQ
jgi:metal-sulfur cluster biosynthetic enzyme